MTDLLRKFRLTVFNERGETINDGGEPEGDSQNSSSGDADSNLGQQQTINWEDETNPYKKRYSDSQSQVQPLVQTLQQFAEYDHKTKTWNPKQSQKPQQGDADFEKELSEYDPDFVKRITGWTQKQIDSAIKKYREESVSMQKYNSEMLDNRNKAIAEFGSEFEFAKYGKMNPNSPLYQMADQILQNKYVTFNPDGSFQKYNNPEAEYLAVVEAYAVLSRKAKTQQPDTNNKGKLGAIQGKGSKSSGIKKQLSKDEYFALSDEERDAYDLQQIGG